MLITSINLALKTPEHAIIAWTEIHNALGEKLFEITVELGKVKSTDRNTP